MVPAEGSLTRTWQSCKVVCHRTLPPNKPLQPDELRVWSAAYRQVILAPLAAERRIVSRLLKHMDELERLSELIRERNENGRKITALVNRPALIGHGGEYIASKLFDIHLEQSAVSKGLDGRFRTGELVGRSVNVKWYAKKEELLDIREDALPDYYLVLAGPNATILHSRGEVRPWHIDSVHLFNARDLVGTLRGKGVKIGIATSVVKKLWAKAELFPRQSCTDLLINEAQRRMLGLYASEERSISSNAG